MSKNNRLILNNELTNILLPSNTFPPLIDKFLNWHIRFAVLLKWFKTGTMITNKILEVNRVIQVKIHQVTNADVSSYKHMQLAHCINYPFWCIYSKLNKNDRYFHTCILLPFWRNQPTLMVLTRTLLISRHSDKLWYPTPATAISL
jgi:hypothetical protein